MYFCMLRQKVLVQLMAIIVIDCLLRVLIEISAQGLSMFAALVLFFQLMFSVRFFLLYQLAIEPRISCNLGKHSVKSCIPVIIHLSGQPNLIQNHPGGLTRHGHDSTHCGQHHSLAGLLEKIGRLS